MMRAVLAFVVLSGCSAALPPPSRVVCYAVADVRAQARVDAECGGAGDAGVPFAQCPAHDSIIAELKAAQEACK
jgi:hypothetical protein